MPETTKAPAEETKTEEAAKPEHKSSKAWLPWVIIALVFVLVFVVALFAMNARYGQTQKQPADDTASFNKDTLPRIDASLATQPLTDAFVRNASVKPLLADAIYTRLVTWRGERTYWSIQEDNKAEFDYDGETLKILNRVDFSKTDNFFLSPNSISFIVDNSIYEIKAKDHIKYFGYYDAYASSESPFNNDDGLKNIPLTNTYSNSLSYNVFDETETGTYTFEIINYYSWIENDLQLNQKLGEYYRKKMPKSDAYTVLQVGGRIRDGEEDSPLKLFTGDYVFCKMSKTDYQNTFRKKIFDAKKPTGVAMLDWIAAIDVNYGCDEKISSDPLIIDAENNLHKLSDVIKDEYFTDTYCPLLSQNKQADCRKNFDKYYTHEYSYETFIITERDNTENVSSVFIPDEIPREYFNDSVKF